MGHVRQKKSTSSSTSTPPEPLAIEFVNLKEHPRENRYPEQLNAEELISQINCSRNLNSNCNNNSNAAIVQHHNNSINLQNNNNSNDVRNSNDNNNNSHAVNSSNNHHQQNQQQQQRRESVEVDDVEKGSDDMERNYRQKSLFRRLYSFIRNLWIGAKFNVGKDGKKIF